MYRITGAISTWHWHHVAHDFFKFCKLTTTMIMSFLTFGSPYSTRLIIIKKKKEFEQDLEYCEFFMPNGLL